MSRSLVSALLLVLVSSATSACVSVQDYGGAPPPASDPSLGSADAGPAAGPPQWQWWNPAPTGRTLLAVGGTGDDDVWVAGEGGTIAHYDGAAWDLRKSGTETRYFAVGTRAKGDVWVAGATDGTVEVLHYDGNEWAKSYPFAGATFNGFSHGPGHRLFAFVDWDILELTDAGTWERTDTSENGVFGPPADVWVGATGEAWTITTGAKVLRLDAGSKTWRLQDRVAPAQARGLAISGAGSELCAFYTSTASGTGVGYLRYDGSWHASPVSTDSLAFDGAPHGARLGCLADGSGILAYGGDAIVGSVSAAPRIQTPYDFPDEHLFGAWSNDGKAVHAVGSFGAFVSRASGATTWKDDGKTLRKDLLTIDVGFDGAMMALDALQPDRSSGGEVLFSKTGSFAPYSGAGFGAPLLPVGVAVVAADDAWVLANDNSMVGVSHWTGKWSVTSFLKGSGPVLRQPLAIWAPAKDDVWATAVGSVWHYADAKWSEVATGATYRGIHGTGPSDVWLAGDEGVAHWDGTALAKVPALTGKFSGVWSSAKERVWLWGDRAILFDGTSSVPVETALHASTEWTVQGIAEAQSGDVFVLTKRAVGTSLLWFDSTRTKLVDVIASDRELSTVRGRGDDLWAVGAGGACLTFAPPLVR